MKETRLLCDFCGKPIAYIDYDYQQNFRIKVQRYGYGGHCEKKWINIDICASCQSTIHKWFIRARKKWDKEN